MQVFGHVIQILSKLLVSHKHIDRCFLISKYRAVQYFCKIEKIDRRLEVRFDRFWFGHVLDWKQGINRQAWSLICHFLRL